MIAGGGKRDCRSFSGERPAYGNQVETTLELPDNMLAEVDRTGRKVTFYLETPEDSSRASILVELTQDVKS